MLNFWTYPALHGKRAHGRDLVRSRPWAQVLPAQASYLVYKAANERWLLMPRRGGRGGSTQMAASGPVGGQRAAGQDVQVAASGPVGVYSSPDAELRELQVGLWSAIYSHNRDMVYQLLRPRHCHGGPGEAKGADIEDLRGFGTDQNWGGGALHWAVQLGYGTIVLLLLSLGADCRRKDRKNRTPYELIHDKCSVRRIPGQPTQPTYECNSHIMSILQEEMLYRAERARLWDPNQPVGLNNPIDHAHREFVKVALEMASLIRKKEIADRPIRGGF
jgi:hypothetical protein